MGEIETVEFSVRGQAVELESARQKNASEAARDPFPWGRVLSVYHVKVFLVVDNENENITTSALRSLS